ncbi:MAG: mannitol-1-phosphate 5-dehydrogenase [Rhodothermales bacterium]|jgi:mannitol-1-phosphate 5-dehydrogenase
MATFVGFGFGPIQASIYLYEAARSERFDRLVVVDVDPVLIAALRAADGCFHLNIAEPDGVRVETVRGIEILNLTDPADQPRLRQALADAAEIATALPSVDFYGRGTPSVAGLLAECCAPGTLIHTAENHRDAAQNLAQAMGAVPEGVAIVDSVIGKMSSVVSGSADLAAMVPGLDRAFLVEAFNRILISAVPAGITRRIDAFIEKSEIGPFEDAKLYGHNAIHAMLGYMAHARGYSAMSELADDCELRKIGRVAFTDECGAGLIARHAGCDPLFTPAGIADYADDLLPRMLNPYLRDPVARVIRDPRRKLGWDDRLIGAMRLALAAGVQPIHLASSAAFARGMLDEPLASIWGGSAPTAEAAELLALIG